MRARRTDPCRPHCNPARLLRFVLCIACVSYHISFQPTNHSFSDPNSTWNRFQKQSTTISHLSARFSEENLPIFILFFRWKNHRFSNTVFQNKTYQFFYCFQMKKNPVFLYRFSEEKTANFFTVFQRKKTTVFDIDIGYAYVNHCCAKLCTG